MIPTVLGIVQKRMLRSFPAGTYPTEGTRREPRYAVVDNGGSRRTDGRPEFHERSQAMSGTSGSRRSWGKIRVKKVRGGTSYYAEYPDPRPDRKGDDGRRKRIRAPFAFSSRQAAEGWLAQQRNRIDGGIWVDPRDEYEDSASARKAEERRSESFRDYAERWFGGKIARGEIRPSTVRTYRQRLDSVLYPAFGDKAMRDITVEDVERWYEEMGRPRKVDGRPSTKERPRLSTRGNAYGLLRQIMQSACTAPNAILDFNPCQIKGGSAHKGRERAVIGPEKVREIADNMPGKYRLVVLLGFWLSLRIGEILALRRRDIDLDGKVVRITHAVTYSKEYGFVDGDPKTEAGIRSIPIPDGLVAEIRKHIDEYADPGDDGKLFHTATGNFVHHSEVEKAFIKARRKAGCEDVVLHGLRHSGNTYFAQNTNATIADLQARGGWSTSSMAAHYMHSSQDRLRQLTKEMSAANTVHETGSDNSAGAASELESLRSQLEEANKKNNELMQLVTERYGTKK